MKIKHLPQEISKESCNRIFRIVDLENLTKGAINVGLKSKKLSELVVKSSPLGEKQMTVVAVGILAFQLFPDILWDWKYARFCIGRGIDGADKELLSVLSKEPAASKSALIQIWSGDHCFADPARRLRDLGCEVEVFAFSRSLSNDLAEAATKVRILNDRKKPVVVPARRLSETSVRAATTKQEYEYKLVS